MGVVVRLMVTLADREKCYAIRMKVFVEEQKVPPWEELDSEDESAVHFLAEEDGVAVGTARLLTRANGVGKIGRVAVLPECRNRHIGTFLMQAVMNHSYRLYNLLELDAQLQVIPFYEKLGFAAEGPIFLDANIPHRHMTRPRKQD